MRINVLDIALNVVGYYNFVCTARAEGKLNLNFS